MEKLTSLRLEVSQQKCLLKKPICLALPQGYMQLPRHLLELDPAGPNARLQRQHWPLPTFSAQTLDCWAAKVSTMQLGRLDFDEDSATTLYPRQLEGRGHRYEVRCHGCRVQRPERTEAHGGEGGLALVTTRSLQPRSAGGFTGDSDNPPVRACWVPANLTGADRRSGEDHVAALMAGA